MDSYPSIKAIVEEYIRIHKFDGLWNGDIECACEASRLFPCDEPDHEHCKVGYKIDCDCGEHDWHIGKKE